MGDSYDAVIQYRRRVGLRGALDERARGGDSVWSIEQVADGGN